MTEREDAERATFRSGLGIPDSLASCHTAQMNDYVIEGHVPAAALRRVLDDRPELVGLALPGMPANAPGMGGNAGSWASQPVVAVTADGDLAPFSY